MTEYLSITPDVKLGKNVKLSKFINLYGCEIGDNTKIGAFVEIQKNAKIGNNFAKFQAIHSPRRAQRSRTTFLPDTASPLLTTLTPARLRRDSCRRKPIGRLRKRW